MSETERSFYDPKNHRYVEHPTYTGEGCALCGRPKDEHEEVVFDDPL